MLVRSDLILLNTDVNALVFLRAFYIGEDDNDGIRHFLLTMIKANWNSFFEREYSRSILDFQLCIDTGYSPLVCCH